MTDKTSLSRPLTKMPFSRLIKLMVAVMGVCIVFVLIAASQQPQTNETKTAHLAKRVTGFETAFPPRPVPPALLTLYEEPFPKEAAVFIWSRQCRKQCSDEVARLARIDPSKVIVVFYSNASGVVPLEVKTVMDPEETLRSFTGPIPDGMAVLYRDGVEIGRGKGVDWSSPAAIALLRSVFNR